MSKNHSQWKTLHYLWDSVNDFEERWNGISGLHTVLFPESNISVDFLVNDLVQNCKSDTLPVFFGGAISNRAGKSGPFFSGRNLSESFNLPMIAIADPSIDAHGELSIAWYTGAPSENLQSKLVSLLIAISRSLGRELILVGGSGGGFAALTFGHQLGERCSVLVWNPQTDIYRYSERFVKVYLRSLFGFAHSTLARTDWIDYCRPRTDRSVRTNILDAKTLRAPRRVLYLQNATDWHREAHLNPLWNATAPGAVENGKNFIDENHLVFVHELASGHEPPSTSEIGRLLVQFMNSELNILEFDI